jgi:uncharacterized phage protein gp47/JayE
MGDLPTRQDLMAVARRSLRIDAAANPVIRLNPAMIDVDGSDVNLIMGAGSLMGEALSASWGRCMLGFFVDTARKDELDRIAADRFGLLRKPATAATVSLTLIRPNAGAGGGTVNAGARVTTATGEVFALNIDVVFGALDLQKTVIATAVVVGRSQNVVALSLSAFVDAPFDTTIVPANPAPAAGGTDQETDPQFRARIRGFWLTVRRGTIAAIQYGARQVPGVSVATASIRVTACPPAPVRSSWATTTAIRRLRSCRPFGTSCSSGGPSESPSIR